MNGLFNGAPVDDPLAGSRGLHYGDGVFRTLLVHQRQPVDLGRHLDRLAADCRTLQIAPPDRATLTADVLQLASGRDRAVIKIIAMRRAGGRGYHAGDDGCDRLLLAYPVPAYPASCWEAGVRVIRSEVILAAQPRLAGAKHLNRLEQVLASRDWPEGVDEALMGDADGLAICGTRTSLFWVDDAGGLHAPSLERCGVDGVSRRKIMELSAQLQVKVIIEPTPWAALDAAAEIFLANALVGIWPVRELAGRNLRAPGSLTRRLAQALAHPRA